MDVDWSPGLQTRIYVINIYKKCSMADRLQKGGVLQFIDFNFLVRFEAGFCVNSIKSLEIWSPSKIIKWNDLSEEVYLLPLRSAEINVTETRVLRNIQKISACLENCSWFDQNHSNFEYTPCSLSGTSPYAGIFSNGTQVRNNHYWRSRHIFLKFIGDQIRVHGQRIFS